MIYDNIYRKFGLFQIVTLGAKDFKDYEKSLVIYIIVEFSC